jgi:hypothetical protein
MARKRDVGSPLITNEYSDYLCAACCAKQDAAQTELLHAMDTSAIQGEWLDDIVAKLETALEKAKESL